MTAPRSLALLLATLAVASSACVNSTDDGEAVTGDDQNLNEAATPRQGSSISSPSVDPAEMYWGSRTIKTLVDIGYLNTAESSVAMRADGILGNSPPNGHIGVDELAALESPEHVNTLFPEEKAVIPKLWKILLIEDATSYTPSAVSIPVTNHDAYPHAQFQLEITKLVAGLQQLGKRIELTQDSDGDAATISGSDVAGAWEDQASYLPAEIKQLRQIHQAIADAAPKLAGDAQYVELPAAKDTVLATVAGVDLVAQAQFAVSGSWQARQPKTMPVVRGSVNLIAKKTDPATQIVVLDKENGVDSLVRADQPSAGIGRPSRVEIWKGGARVGELDAIPGKSADAAIPFGYAVKIGGVESVLNCQYNYSAGGLCSYVPSNSASSRSSVPATSYFLAGHPDYRVDVFANGRALLVGPGSTTTCYPNQPSRNGYPITGCTLYSPTWQNAGTITFAHPNGDDPALAWGSFPTLGTQSLYAY